jgi:hypothetical protein
MSAVGIKQILLCDIGHLRNAPRYCVAMGMGDAATFDRTEVPVKGNNDEDFEGTVNHKHSFKTFQFGAADLAYLLYYCKIGGADLEAVGQKISNGIYTGVYDYTGANPMGVEFELLQSSKERSILITAEAAFETTTDRNIMQNANSIVPIDLNALGLGHRGVQPGKYVAPSISTLYNPQGTALCNGYQIIDRVYSIKCDAVKKEFNRSQVNWLIFNFVLTIDKVNAWELVEYLTRDRNASLRLDENAGNGSFSYIFDSNLFWRKTELNISKTVGNIKLTFNRKISVGDIAIDIINNTFTVSGQV